MTPDSALDYFPWFFLAQPAPLPERLIESQAEFFLQTIFDSWPASPESITADSTVPLLGRPPCPSST